MERFVISLPDESSAAWKRITFFILLINLLLLLSIYLGATAARIQTFSFIAAMINLLSLVFFLLNTFTKKMTAFRVEISFIVLAVLWFVLTKYLLGLSILCCSIIGIYAKRRLDIIFTRENIGYPSFPAKNFPWKSVSNVILKDNMLTIDLKNNKVIQAVISKESALKINEHDFNLFCRDCLKF